MGAAGRYVIRHGLDAMFGWLGIVYLGRLAGRWFGGWSGVLALALLVLSPRYFAHSMNNPKDLPFAAMTVVGLYYISTISPRWPYLTRGQILKIAIPLALALNIRAAALLYLGYFGLLVLIYVALERPGWRRFLDTALRVSAVTMLTLVAGTAFWPWAQGNPIVRPIQAAIGLTEFPWDGPLLFVGRDLSVSELPRYYAPWYFLITTPPVVLGGLALSLVPRRPGTLWSRAGLWVVGAGPIVLAVVRHATLYDGIRHLLFVYPAFVALAAGGWSDWIAVPQRWGRRAAGAALAVGLAAIAVFHVRAFPNEAAYFNQIVGGPAGAFGNYDQDYWGNCMQEAVRWAAKVARLSHRPVGVSGNEFQIVQLDAEPYPELFYAPPTSIRYHLDIRLSRGSAASVRDLAARGDALYRVTMPDGAVLCVVLPGPAFAELKPHMVLAGALRPAWSPRSALVEYPDQIRGQRLEPVEHPARDEARDAPDRPQPDEREAARILEDAGRVAVDREVPAQPPERPEREVAAGKAAASAGQSHVAVCQRPREEREERQPVLRFPEGEFVHGGEEAAPARLEDAMNFSHQPRGIVEPVIHLVADDHVERCGREAEIGAAHFEELEIRSAVSGARDAQRLDIDVDADDGGRRPGEQIGDDARRAADVEDAAPGKSAGGAQVIVEHGADLPTHAQARLPVEDRRAQHREGNVRRVRHGGFRSPEGSGTA